MLLRVIALDGANGLVVGPILYLATLLPDRLPTPPLAPRQPAERTPAALAA